MLKPSPSFVHSAQSSWLQKPGWLQKLVWTCHTLSYDDIRQKESKPATILHFFLIIPPLYYYMPKNGIEPLLTYYK